MNTQPTILTLNSGSSSLKFGIFKVKSSGLVRLYYGAISDLNATPRLEIFDTENKAVLSGLEIQMLDKQPASYLLALLEKHLSLPSFTAVGHRVVHGGDNYSAPTLIDAKTINKLQDLIPLAPLHLPNNLAAIQTLRQERPGLLQIACFDTAFHRSMDWKEQTYALPREYFQQGLRRYGFHGLSYEYIARVLSTNPEITGQSRIVVAHLGHGASLCAMQKGKSLATTMGFTPLDGIPMATRPGSLDPGAIPWLMREADLSLDQVEKLLNQQSGLLGLSGISDDMQVLLQSHTQQAKQAIDYFIHHSQRAIASMAAVMGGMDVLVFTGGIGENAASIRQRICHKCKWLGVRIDDELNSRKQLKISPAGASISTWCIPTNEEEVIARHTLQFIEGTAKKENYHEQET